MEQYQKKLAGIWKRNNCHPVKSILPILVQAPVFIGFFTSLRSMADAKVIPCACWPIRQPVSCAVLLLGVTLPLYTPLPLWFPYIPSVLEETAALLDFTGSIKIDET